VVTFSSVKAATPNNNTAPSLNNPAVQANLQSLLNQNPELANQIQQTLAGSNQSQASALASGEATSSASSLSSNNNVAALASGETTPTASGTNPNNAATLTPGQTNQTTSASATMPAPAGTATSTGTINVNNPWQTQDPSAAALRAQSFQNVTTQAFPLTPEQIQTLNNMLDDTQRAQAAAPYNAPPMPTSTSLLVNLDPGATPPVIRLSKGFVSSLVFIDSTGAPWPIEAYDLGNPSAFNIKWDTKSNTLMIQAMATYTYGNLAVKLQNLNTPVMLTLVPGQKQIDYRVDLRIQGMGPFAKPNIGGSGLPGQADQQLLDILDGIAPSNAKQLNVPGGLADAWLQKNVLFVRTRFDLISPGWISKMSSADGTNAYKLQPTPLLLISRYGKVVSLKVEGL